MVLELGQGKYKLGMEHLVVSGGKKCPNKKDGSMLKGHSLKVSLESITTIVNSEIALTK